MMMVVMIGIAIIQQKQVKMILFIYPKYEKKDCCRNRLIICVKETKLTMILAIHGRCFVSALMFLYNPSSLGNQSFGFLETVHLFHTIFHQ